MDKINVLIFPAGEINSIELHDALCTCVNINLFGASSRERHGKYVFEDYTPGLPLIFDTDFFEKFNAYLDEKHIDVIFPTHDTVATFFADNQDKLHAKIVAADQRTSRICRDKALTYETFADCEFTPRIYSNNYMFPVFAKPREGQGGVGARLVKTPAELPVNISDFTVCEYLPGEECTVDCLTDKNGILLFASPRLRKRMMAGVCVSGENLPLSPEIEAIAKTINERLSFKGLWFFQLKKSANGEWRLMEVSTRCAGTMCLTRARGVNLPLLSVYVTMGYDVAIKPNEYSVSMDRTLISRYTLDFDYDTVYFDFDDTLIVRSKVNLKAIWFLYQCRNQGKRVKLLTKHEKEIYDSMAHYAINPNIFNEIIHIKPEDYKSKYINPARAIFVDNAYQERAAVSRSCHIPVFDVDGIEFLMDWKS